MASTVCFLLSDNLDLIKTLKVMFDGIWTLKLGGFRNSKPNFKEYSRKNEEKNNEKSSKGLKYFENTFKINLSLKMFNNRGHKGCL